MYRLTDSVRRTYIPLSRRCPGS